MNIHLFICSLLDTFSETQIIVSNERVENKQWIGKNLEWNDCGLILSYYPGIRLGGLRKTTKDLSQDSRSAS
jgi:hypothetical protein